MSVPAAARSLAPHQMTNEEYLLFNELIEKRFGLSFPPERKPFLESRLSARLNLLFLTRYIDYYLYLEADEGEEVQHLASAITNNETYFFRAAYQFESLFHDALPQMRESRGRATFDLLCAGCSSGEEAYTIKIFAQHGSGVGPCRVRAFDIDVERIDAARRAVYEQTSLRNLAPHQVDRFFTAPQPGRYDLRSPFQDNVEFSVGNILDPDSYSGLYDAVFCRNVLIYFSDRAFAESIENFASVLRPGGLLFLGHSESIIGRTSLFRTVRLKSCIAYEKVER